MQYQRRSNNMDFSVEKKISNFIEGQFPQFYQEEGTDFILFMKAYYEWLELETQPVGKARSIFDYRDIDNTLTEFLEHFQLKYLYGIPFNVIINKRFLLKHILDVYRSKGTIQCYKLLFKLIYNQDIDIYLPGVDLLKPSDGTWVEPLYLEVTDNPNIQSLVGKTIVGTSSGTTATIESFITEPINNNIDSTVFISNMMPKGGQFIYGEKIVDINYRENTQIIQDSPTVLGSLDYLNIINGGQNFNIGDVIKIAHRDISNNSVISSGIDGKLKVTGLSRALGSINFNIEKGGFGYTSDANILIYKNSASGNGAAFNISNYSYKKSIEYNTDLIVDYYTKPINSATFGFPANTSANNSSNLNQVFSYQNNYFGTIASLTNINTGNGYTDNLNIFVRSTQVSSNALPGTISYSTASNTITGSGTLFQGNSTITFFANGDVICLQANSSNASSIEYQVIKSVNSNTNITLYGPTKYNSTGQAIYKNAPVILPSNFAIYEPTMYRPDGTINGINEKITGIPSSGNNIIANTIAIDSGKGYNEGEIVYAYLYNGLNSINISNGGIGYSNAEPLNIFGGDPSSVAYGYVTTDGTGSILSAVLNNGGSNYKSNPSISVKTANGTGAILTASVSEFNTTVKVTGKVVKTGVGRRQGYWSTTRGFLNSDKYIQDSEYYQDYSYLIKAALTLDKYKDILYNTFHTAGSELFGQFYQQLQEGTSSKLIYEPKIVLYVPQYPAQTDSNLIRSDNPFVTADQVP
jgi:hypothetical protein